MACVTHPGFDHRDITVAAPRHGVLAGVGHLLSRFIEAIAERSQSETEQAIENLVMRSGGRLTDGIEREIEQRMMGPTSFMRR